MYFDIDCYNTWNGELTENINIAEYLDLLQKNIKIIILIKILIYCSETIPVKETYELDWAFSCQCLVDFVTSVVLVYLSWVQLYRGSKDNGYVC